MNRSQYVMDLIIALSLVGALVLGILSLTEYLPDIAIVIPFIIVIIAIRLDKLQRQAFAINTLDVLDKKAEWNHTLVYSYSIKWLKFVYWYEIKYKKNYPIVYEFCKFEELPRDIRQGMIKKYFDQQNV
jgi:hypothetical protein